MASKSEKNRQMLEDFLVKNLGLIKDAYGHYKFRSELYSNRPYRIKMQSTSFRVEIQYPGKWHKCWGNYYGKMTQEDINHLLKYKAKRA